jgi:RNA polymerase sigma factor (sigma-70 family)
MGSLSSEDDQARFASVVLPHLADAYALARWLTGDRAEAEDVVQEACLRAFRNIGGFAGINARAWLLTIVRHAAYTWLGKNRSASLLVVDDLEAVERQQAGGASAFGQEPQTGASSRRRLRSCRCHFGRRWCCVTCRAWIIGRLPR